MRIRFFVASFFLASIGCTALIGVRDLTYDENAEGGASSSGGSSGTGSSGASSGGSSGTGMDGGNCNADLNTDPANCGRCGRDCGGNGSTCTAGRCSAITLAAPLMNPSGIFVTTDKVYVTLDQGHKLIELNKTPGTPRDLVVETKELWGVWVEGTTIYYAIYDYTYAGDGGQYRGAIWKCTLPDCTNKTVVAVGDMPQNPIVHNGKLYYVSDNDNTVLLAQPDGGGFVLDNSYDPFSLAADDTHLYYTSWQPSFWRIQLSDGGSESIGTQGNSGFGGLALDNDHVYYSYGLDEEAGSGRVVSLLKNNVGQRMEYGTGGNTMPRGLVVDATNIYWSNWGTYDQGSGASNNDGDVRYCPLAGCPASGPVVLAKGLARPYQMAQDTDFIYFNVFTNSGENSGSVQKVRKP